MWCTQFLTNADGSGKYGFIVAIPANVINILGGVLSANQVPSRCPSQVPCKRSMSAAQPHILESHLITATTWAAPDAPGTPDLRLTLLLYMLHADLRHLRLPGCLRCAPGD
jgi:hypothetical protein